MHKGQTCQGAKKWDIIDLLPFIPLIYHRCFQNLVTTANEDDIGPLPYDEEVNGEQENCIEYTLVKVLLLEFLNY